MGNVYLLKLGMRVCRDQGGLCKSKSNLFKQDKRYYILLSVFDYSYIKLPQILVHLFHFELEKYTQRACDHSIQVCVVHLSLKVS